MAPCLKDLASRFASEQKASTSVQEERPLGTPRLLLLPTPQGQKLVVLTIFERLLFKRNDVNDNLPVKIT